MRICVRALRPHDRERQTAFIESLSERSRYFRLFSPLKALPPYLLDQLMEVDYERRMALAATIECNSAEEFVGIAHYARTDRSGAADVAVVVADEWQRRGIASLLLNELMSIARRHGIRRFTGIMLPDNDPMIGLARSLDFQTRFDLTQCLFTTSRELVPTQS